MSLLLGSMAASSDYISEKNPPMGLTVDETQLDVAAHLQVAGSIAVSQEEASRLRRKIDLHLMPFMCILYLMTFADKTTLGQSAVLGIQKGAHLTQNQFNWLGTIFYLSYLVFIYPQSWALQRFPVAKWMSVNIFIWSIALCAHASCHSFGALFACRFILGMCEGAITPGFLIVTSMFYTHSEQIKRVGYWFLMNGFAIIILGFLSFGVLHTKTKLMPWQWLMLITGLLTFIIAIIFWFFFPDSPTTARFLTPEERALAVERIKVNQTGVENKRFKKEQFIEALKDPKIWVMAVFAALSNVYNSLTNQRQLIVNQFGFTPIQTTLLGCVDGVVEILTIWLGVTLASQRQIGRAYAGALMYIPTILGAILVSTLPFHNKVGLLFSYWISVFGVTPFVIALGWIGSLTSGHTKRVTTNAIVVGAYAIGNAAGPFIWKKKYQPRNHVPWAILTACSFVSALLLIVLRFMYTAENKRRNSEKHDDTYDNVVAVIDVNGEKNEKKVDREFLDLTDVQNRDFRYVL